MSVSPAVPVPRSGRRFVTTRWSQVLNARGSRTPAVCVALESLCRTYWIPVYVLILKDVRDPENAQDLTQSFFVTLLDRDVLGSVHPERGRFRSFLCAAVRHFLSNERDRAAAGIRGGKHRRIALDDPAAIDGLTAEVMESQSTAEEQYERRWAESLLDQVMQRLAAEYSAAGKAAVFAELSGHISGGESSELLAVSAERLGLSVGNVRVSLHRLRRRYRAILREEVSHTTDSVTAVDDEIRYLFTVLQRPSRSV